MTMTGWRNWIGLSAVVVAWYALWFAVGLGIVSLL